MRFFCLILSIFLCLSLLAGCGSGSIANNESDPPFQSSTQESQQSILQQSDDTAPTDSSEEISLPDESSAPVEEAPKEELLPLISSHGKELLLYGDLMNPEFEDAATRLKAVLDGYDKSVAMVVYSLDDYKAVSYNTQECIFPASMIKAAYALYCCQQMELGNGNLQTEMVYEKKHYEIGTGDLQYFPVGSVFTMETIIEKTMSISDNVGYLMMVDYFGRDGYNQWITELGAPSLQIKPTVWCLSANVTEWAIVWREIYNYFNTHSEYAEFLYNCCTNTAGNFATAGIENANYSHKQGHQRSGDWHSYSDAGILWKENGSYVFAILTDAPGPSSYEAEFFKDVMAIVDSELFA